MTRDEHNRKFGVSRKGSEQVLCNTFGYGEISQYDPRCPSCWLGHPHTWDRHDAAVLRSRASEGTGAP